MGFLWGQGFVHKNKLGLELTHLLRFVGSSPPSTYYRPFGGQNIQGGAPTVMFVGL